MTIDDKTARRLLEEERHRLLEDAETVAGDLGEEQEGAGDELSSYDQHPAEMGTEVADQERDAGLRADFAGRLEENAEATRRVDEGRYGRCERCGRPIDDERLRAVPSARYCQEDHLAVASGR